MRALWVPRRRRGCSVPRTPLRLTSNPRPPKRLGARPRSYQRGARPLEAPGGAGSGGHGCGVCVGPQVGGQRAHAIIQANAHLGSEGGCVGEVCFRPGPGAASPELGNIRLDLLSGDLLVDGDAGGSVIRIGEIKPTNLAAQGVGDLSFYTNWLAQNRPGTTVELMPDYPGPPQMTYLDPESPLCPQVLVITKAAPGLFLYECFPKNEVLALDPKCGCDKSQKKRSFGWKNVAIALSFVAVGIAITKKAAAKAIEEITAKLIAEQTRQFARALLEAELKQIEEQAAKQAAKTAASVLAILKAAAAVILLFSSDAKLQAGPGDDWLMTLAEEMGRNGAPLPDEIKQLADSDPDLKAMFDKSTYSHDTSDKRAALNARMLSVINDHASEFTADDLKRLLSVTQAVGAAVEGVDMTIERLHSLVEQPTAPEGGEQGSPGAGRGSTPGAGGSSGPDDRQDGKSDSGGADGGFGIRGAGQGLVQSGGTPGPAVSPDDVGDGQNGRVGQGTQVPPAGALAPGQSTPPAQSGSSGAPDPSQIPGGTVGPGGTQALGTPSPGPSAQNGAPGDTTAPGSTAAPGPASQVPTPGETGAPGGASAPGAADQDQAGGGGQGGGNTAGAGKASAQGTISTATTKVGPARTDAKNQKGFEKIESDKFGSIPKDTYYLWVAVGTTIAAGVPITVWITGRDAGNILVMGNGQMTPISEGGAWFLLVPAGVVLYSSGGPYLRMNQMKVPMVDPSSLKA